MIARGLLALLVVLGLAAPAVLPVWPVATVSTDAGQPAVSAALPVVAHGR